MNAHRPMYSTYTKICVRNLWSYGISSDPIVIPVGPIHKWKIADHTLTPDLVRSQGCKRGISDKGASIKYVRIKEEEVKNWPI